LPFFIFLQTNVIFLTFLLVLKKDICYKALLVDEFKYAKAFQVFPSSAVVAQLTVNQLVGGSNPSWGAIFHYL
jgi:hypothetical protein